MQKTCDSCQTTLDGPAYGTFAVGWTCPTCGSAYNYYCRIDGELLDLPSVSGKCIGVVFEQDDMEKLPNETSHFVRGTFFYIFQGDDGTIRRAHIETIPLVTAIVRQISPNEFSITTTGTSMSAQLNRGHRHGTPRGPCHRLFGQFSRS